MQVYTTLTIRDSRDIRLEAPRAEALGFDGLTFAELAHDGFLMSALALEHTNNLKVGPSVSLAFPRSPMVTAYAAWDLQHLYEGRFQLGLGTQVKGHIERRFSVPWVAPAPRIREYIQALRAIWSCWQDGVPLDFRGNHYSFTLMIPEVSPGPSLYPAIPIYLAAVGPAMGRVAGQVSDGIVAHSFTTALYTQQVLIPKVEQGILESGRARDNLMLDAGGFIATGANEEEVIAHREDARRSISFYGSTRTYKPVLDLHGWGELCLELHGLSVKGKWDQMPALVSDEIVDAFCVTGTYDQIAPRLKERYKGFSSRLRLNLPTEKRYDDHLGALVEELKK